MSNFEKKVSQETIDNILQHLSINEIENLDRSIETSKEDQRKLAPSHLVQSTLADRQNPIKYLDKAFHNSAKLLTAMGMAEVFLSGSRALEYFIVNICDENSDWDFYCPSEVDNILFIMKTFENSGVVWESNKDKLCRLVNEIDFSRHDDPEIDFILDDVAEIERLLESTVADSIKDLKDINNNFYKSVNNDIIERMIFLLDADYSGELPCIAIRGTVVKNNKINKVQLIYGTETKSAFDLILRFHSSIVQCFLSFNGACHLYYDAAVERESYYWKSNEGRLTDEIFDKYLRRGVTFIDPVTKLVISDQEVLLNIKEHNQTQAMHHLLSNGKIEHRMLIDNKSKFISFTPWNNSTLAPVYDSFSDNPNRSDIEYTLNNFIDESEIELKCMSWYELSDRLILSDNIVSSLLLNKQISYHVKYRYIRSRAMRTKEQVYISNIRNNIKKYTGSNELLNDEEIIRAYFTYHGVTDILEDELPDINN
jgi:hypothetical protein